MLTARILLTLAVSATIASAAPPKLLPRQIPEFGSCDRCTQAVSDLGPYCHYKPAEECKKACESRFLDPLNACATCLASDTTANEYGRNLVRDWIAHMDEACKPPAQTTYGQCNTCEKAIEDLTPFCHGKSAEVCRTACKSELLDPLKTCSDCISSDTTATQQGKDLVSQWQSHMDTQCRALGGSCTEQCGAIRPDMEAQCGTSGASFSGCRELCNRFDSASNCASCQQNLGGLPDLMGVSWGALQWYCQNGCGPTCMGVVDQINSQCKDEATCYTAMCSGDAKAKLDECSSCLSSGPIIQTQMEELQSGVTTVVNLCKGSKPGGTMCFDECNPILTKDNELCQAGDQIKCRGMCADENISAMAKCNECVNRSDYTDSKEAKDGITNYYGSLTNWCKQQTTNPGTVNPPTAPSTPFVPVPGGGGSSGGGSGTRPGAITIGAPGTTTTGRAGSAASARPSSAARTQSSIDSCSFVLGVGIVAIVAGLPL
ncbi:hypothetical protein CC85DRAFT_289685 [Cutaneotrichosporon oleaginosum]|uniref:Extracellular membrane protein CFEM domain-containing protein n=1 Tax=Cutaneotrichosporon oleaginosum TaxID=879819 RepID=A0A0J0XZ59_9TREE|nr:uncharacterized protein CC85DRAFT_289685 [Cutaneotrichosporon oleaginosum]KLT46326.1 hypothetical protein CC85DRAFT_289685 [Cutaneotrichosporon oleaginosum]TXT15302.1 hypothetical protein COLE_01495 [Cutaneotrichosporon oleaginosum]